jgi:2-phosphosulfolactate phosphatase
MSHQLHVHLLPSLIEADALNGGTAVIIDILRASSTMITAMQNGAKRVIPCGTTEEAFRLREQSPNESIILGGERGGVKIQGFDFGNSPAEYSTAAVAGRTVVFTTTNGPKAILKASPAATI